ncbi:MAG: DUF5011 domain-containing protein, partial [Bacteroidales bacterium]|nr:DUF5011 domain-containing protein [Bacteroidales bacterium]
MRNIIRNILAVGLIIILVLPACEKKDDTAPVITIIGDNPLIVTIGTLNFTDPGATAVDNADGDLTASIQTESNVNTNLK